MYTIAEDVGKSDSELSIFASNSGFLS